MAAQKGPGEGYRAAREDALALDPTLTCRGVRYGSAGSPARIIGYVVERDGKTLGTGNISRDAWCAALGALRQEHGLTWDGRPA